MSLLARAEDLMLSLGGTPLFEGVTLGLPAGARTALVGPNGSGKSTLMRIVAGTAEPDAGSVWRQPGTTAVFMEQEPDLTTHPTVGAWVAAGLPAHLAGQDWRAEAACSDWDLPSDRETTGLSGGEARRAALARAFAAEPDILLLDEPTNHLDIATVERLEATLRAFRGALLVVSHDRRFLETVSTRCAWLRRGRVLQLERGFSDFEAWAEATAEAEARELQRMNTLFRAETRWLARGVTARRARNEGRRARLEDLRAARRGLIAATRGREASISAASGAASGRLVFEAQAVSCIIPTPDGGERTLVRELDLRVLRGDRLGIIGPNGAGKSTLIDVLLGTRTPSSGQVRQGANLEIAYFDQRHARLDPDATVRQTLCPLGGDQVLVNGEPRHVASWAKDFLFQPGQLDQPARALSGGERNRLLLAATLARPANVLVLDEPTNDLDMDTLDLLEDMLAAYDGTVILVSHDRAFLDALVGSTLGPVGDGRWVEAPGGYADFERDWGRPTLGAPASARPPSAPAAPARAPSPSPADGATRRKLGFREQRRLDEAAAAMPRLEAEIARLEAELADASLYARDPAGFAARTARLQAARTELDAAETDWLTLSDAAG